MDRQIAVTMPYHTTQGKEEECSIDKQDLRVNIGDRRQTQDLEITKVLLNLDRPSRTFIIIEFLIHYTINYHCPNTVTKSPITKS